MIAMMKNDANDPSPLNIKGEGGTISPLRSSARGLGDALPPHQHRNPNNNHPILKSFPILQILVHNYGAIPVPSG